MRRQLPFLLAASAVGLCAPAGAAGQATLAVAGVRLEVDAESGRVVRALAGSVDLTASAAVPLSGFALADGPKAEFTPATCKLSGGEKGVWHIRGSAGELRLDGEARPLGRGIEVSGQVSDPRGDQGADHAVTLRFALPIGLDGWRLYRDLERSWLLTPNGVRCAAVPCAWGRGKGEIWPVVAVAGKGATLGFGTRIDEPQTFRVSYDGSRALLGIEFDLGLTAGSKRWNRSAPFRFLLLARGDEWGLRGCLADLYATYRELFRRRTELAGGWFAWGDILSIAPPATDFGLAYHEGPDGAKARLHSLALGAATFPYIEPLMYQLPMGDLDRAPTRPEVEERVKAWSQPLSPLPKAHRGAYDQTRCAATAASGIRRADGTLDIAEIGQYPWIAGSRWAAQLALNLDPSIPGGAGELFLREERENMKDANWGEGRYLDSFSAHTNRVDYAPEHLADSELPPQWVADEKAPGGFRFGQPVALGSFAYARGLRQVLDAHGKLILVNQFGHSAPCPFHVFDCLGKEYWVPGSGRLLQRYRAVSSRKVVSDLPSDQPIDAGQLREFLAYGVFPGGYGRGNWGQEAMRATYRRVLPLLRLEHSLGWDPVTHARTTDPGVLIERFGGNGAPLCLALVSHLTPKVVTLTLDAGALKIPAGAWCRELLDDGPVSWARVKERLEVRLAMLPGETKLLAVGSAAQHAAIARTLAADRLAEARRCAAEFELREGKAFPLKPELEKAAADPRPLRALAGRIVGTGVLERRIVGLLVEGAAWADESLTPRPRQSKPVVAPALDAASAGVPWTEDFSQGLLPDRWEIPKRSKSRVEVRDGRLEIELSPQETGVSVSTKRSFDFGAQPLEFRWRFQFNHAGHPYYLMQSVRLAPLAAGGDEFLHFRVDPGIRARLENQDTPASNFVFSLTPYTDFATNAPHQVRLVLTPDRFLLEMDGKKLGEGPHDCTFTQAAITLGVATGHRGHGDVVWWDDLEVRPAVIPGDGRR